LVALKYKDTLIDEVVYGNWDDGNKDNNAPVASDPNSIARKSDGYNTFNNQNDFAVTTKVTKGASNIIVLSESEAELTSNNNWQTSQDIVISEVFPNPVGDDSKNEFIELYNKGDKSVDLIGWRLGDASDKRYQFKQATIIESHEFLAIKRASSSIALNNDEETVKLFVPQSEEPLQTISYTDAPEGQSWNDTNFTAENINNVGLVGVVKKWEWSSMITPGAANIINAPSQPLVVDFDAPTQIEIGKPFIYDSSDTTGGATSSLKYQWDFSDNATSTLSNPEHTFFKTGSFKVKLTVASDNDKASKNKTVKVVKVGALIKTGGVIVKGISYSAAETKVAATKTTKKVASKTKVVNYKTGVLASIEEINNYSKGDKLRVTGTVAVLPGVFGSQYFYIVGSGGLQIYNYKKDFPNLKVGDEITVNGELSAVNSEPRLKTTSAKDFSIVGHKDSFEPATLSYDNLGEEINGGLVKFSGQITEKKGSTIYLDDGNGEVPVYLKKNTGLTAGSFTEGDNVEIAGILIKDASGFKLLPRDRDDIKKAASSSGQVLGEVASSDEWQLAQRDKITEMLKYFLAIAVFVIVVLVGIIIRKMKK
jgi:PKD repeat protein